MGAGRVEIVPADPADVRRRVLAEVDRWADQLVEVSHDLHAHPEIGYTEHHAHDALTAVLDQGGLTVERHAHGLDTAFAATAGSGPDGAHVAVLCEYDALPQIGHACGHNVIGAAGLGAGLAAAAVAEELGGRLTVLGTPAEEGGGGKIHLAAAGAFDGVDAALMIHPAGADLTRIHAIAVHEARVIYHGLASHAASAPELGRNALDAAVLGYMNVAALRQHMGSGERVHGYFTEAGTAANVVPSRTAATWFVRSPTLDGLEQLEARFLTCLEAGAAAAGCTMEVEWPNPVYADMVDNPVLLERYVANAATIGRTVIEPTAELRVTGSTDMGNISHLVPSIHPIIKVSPPDVSIHTEAFERWAGSPEGDRAVIDGAKAMALTIVDLWLDPDLVTAARAAHAAPHP